MSLSFPINKVSDDFSYLPKARVMSYTAALCLAVWWFEVVYLIAFQSHLESLNILSRIFRVELERKILFVFADQGLDFAFLWLGENFKIFWNLYNKILMILWKLESVLFKFSPPEIWRLMNEFGVKIYSLNPSNLFFRNDFPTKHLG